MALQTPKFYLRTGQGGASVTGDAGQALTFQPDGTVNGNGSVVTALMSPLFSAARNQAILQAALDRNAGGTVEVTDGVFPLLGNVDIPSDTHLRMSPGAVLDISAAGNVRCLRAYGSEAPTVLLTVDAAKGATAVTLADVSGLSPRDWIRIASNAVFDASSTNSEIGELVEVKSVAGLVVTLETPLQGGPYTVADVAVASKVTFVENVRVSGGKILGGGTPTVVGVDADCTGIHIWRGRNCTVELTRFERCDQSGMWFQDSIFCRVVGCDFRDAVNDFEAYGVTFDNACQDCECVGVTGARVRHLVTTTNSTSSKGIARRITFGHCHCYSTTTARGGAGGDAFDTHTAAEYIKFVKCVSMFSTGAGFNVETPLATLEDCESYNATGAGFILHNESDQEAGYILTNCRSVRSGAEGYRITHPVRGSVARVRFAKLTGCTAEDPTGIGFYIANVSNTLTLRNITLKDCTVVGGKNNNGSVWLQNVLGGDVDVSVSDPTVVAQFGLVRIRDSMNVNVRGSLRHADASTGVCIYINASGAGLCQKVFVEGVQAGATGAVGLRGVYVDTAATNCRIGVNDFQDCNTPVDLQAGSGHRVYQQPGVATVGDASVTLNVNSPQTQRYGTALTANRTVTLPAASLAPGLAFQVVRDAAATGAFNLDVGGVKTLAAAGTSCWVQSDGTAWRETSASTL